MTRSSGRSAALAAKSKIVTVVEPDAENDELIQKRRLESQDESDFEEESFNSEAIDFESKSLTRVRTGKKKKFTFVPPLSHSWLDGSVCGSFEEMKTAMKAHNSATKRANRQFMTKLYKEGTRERITIDDSLLCKVEEEESTVNDFAFRIASKTEVEFKATSLFTGMPNGLWCDCEACLTGPTQVLLLVTPEQGIHAVRFEIDSVEGFNSNFVPEYCSCSVPFKIACVCLKDGYLCLGSNESSNDVTKVFILSAAAFHGNGRCLRISDGLAAVSLEGSQLTALSLCDFGLLSGTSLGRVRLHSLPRLKESLQLALPSAVPVYALAVVEGAKLVVTGRMSKVLSYPLLEGSGDWLTEASNLPIIPRFIVSREGLIYSDVECHARLIISTVYHSPLSAIFDAMITGMDASPMHSIVALGSAKGAVYLCWLQGLVKRIAPEAAHYWKGAEKEAFVPFKTQETVVKWSQSGKTPGLLAVIQKDSFRLVICDQFIT